MRNGWIKLVGGLGLLAVLAGSYATPVVAQWTRSGRVVPVRNVDERGRAPYMQFQARSCPGRGALTCEIAFAPVTPGNRLVLEHVNASITFAPSGVKRTGLLTPEVGIFVLPVRSTSDPDFVIVNEPTLVYYESGQAPILQIVVNDGTDAPFITAAVSGYLVSLEE